LWRLASRANLANALHQAGDIGEALRLFAEAKRLLSGGQPERPILYSLRGYYYYDLLLGQGQIAEVLSRASQTLSLVEQQRWLLDTGLDHLSLGRAYPARSAEGAHHLDEAVGFLRRAGQVDALPRALLVRGKPHDIEEAFRIATRSGMRLYLADYHLASVRISLASGDRAQARAHFEIAKTLVQETGYHRRDIDLEELRSAIAVAP
jgi:tetratricopeptide (TPR) repeat protein